MGSGEGGHPDLFRCPRFLRICSDLRSLFSGMRHADLFRLVSDFFQFVFRTNQNKSRKHISADPSYWPPAVESSIAVDDAVENRGLYRILVSRLFVSRLFGRGLGHYSATIARLRPLSGLERGG